MLIRWLFITSICIWVVALDGLLPIFFLGLVLLFVLKQQGFLFVNILRVFKLLLWLFIPTLIFNGLFVPGTYMQQPFSLPFTIEGLSRGLYLCAHIALVFFSALVVMRVFSFQEWMRLLEESPFAALLKPYLLMMAGLQKTVKHVVSEQKQVWLNMKNRWKHLPDMLISIVQQVIQEAKREAHQLWQTWDEQMGLGLDSAEVVTEVKTMMYLFPLVLGWGLFWLI